MKSIAIFGLLALISSDIALAAKKQNRRSTRARTVQTGAVVDPSNVNDPNIWQPQQNSGGAAILRAQILLDRAHFSPGQIDGQSGANFERALRAFQESRQLPASGQLDEQTWQALNTDTAPVLIPYTVAPEDVAGPFAPVPKDMMEQAKLEKLAYESPSEALGEQFHISPQLLQRLNPGKNFAAGEEIMVPDLGQPVTGKATQIVVTKSGTLQALDASGKVIAHYPCSSGSRYDPLPLGKWKVKGVAKNPPFHYNPELFWDADPSHSKAKIAPGPNNPVGVVWIDLTKEHYGIHGTPTPGTVGHAQSHGCIRLTNWDAMELAALVAAGTPALLTE
jgi:lipoprotein-anchoring transpeptidase ErfK/SrfK